MKRFREIQQRKEQIKPSPTAAAHPLVHRSRCGIAGQLAGWGHGAGISVCSLHFLSSRENSVFIYWVLTCLFNEWTDQAVYF